MYNFNVDKNNFIQKEKIGLPKEIDRIRSQKELVFENKEGQAKVINIWRSFRSGSQFEEIESRHNESAAKDKNIRPIQISLMLPRGIIRHIEIITEDPEFNPKYIPEVIVLQENDDKSEKDEAIDTIKYVRERIKGYSSHYYLNSGMGNRALGIETEKMFENRLEINDENAIRFGLILWSMEDQPLYDLADESEGLNSAMRKYFQDGDPAVFETILTEEALREIYERMISFDEDEIESDYELVLEDESGKAKDRFPTLESYLEYRKNLYLHGKNYDFEMNKNNLKKECIDFLLSIVNGNREDMARMVSGKLEKDEWEENILQPLIIFISKDSESREKAKKEGADIAVASLSDSDASKIIEFVGKIKSNPASLSPMALNEIKTEFYGSIQEEVENRSKVSAETEKELEILQELFAGENIRSILDVGCGWGRIDMELAKRNDFEITGLDSSEYFLGVGKNKLAQANSEGSLKGKINYKKGEIIDYAKAVENEKFDSVIYTWHSILEAYGSGNILRSLNNAWETLRPGGILVFDQPARENEGLEDGWYGVKLKEEEKYSYLAYVMTEEEISFMLKIAGFEDVEIKKWTTSPNEKYPEGMKKLAVKARKPEIIFLKNKKDGKL